MPETMRVYCGHMEPMALYEVTYRPSPGSAPRRCTARAVRVDDAGRVVLIGSVGGESIVLDLDPRQFRSLRRLEPRSERPVRTRPCDRGPARVICMEG